VVRWRRRLRTCLPYAAVPALMIAAMLTPCQTPRPVALPSEPPDQLAPRADDVEAIEPVDGLGGRETQTDEPTPTHTELEGDTI
jgi:hypothetical protein